MYLTPRPPEFDNSSFGKAFIIAIAMVCVAALLFAATGCTSVKKTTDKKDQVIEQGSTTKIEYRTNTIYTDTGSITTYYRDSLIFKNDTVIQPIERIVNRWFKQQVKHDTLYKLQHDTITVKVKEVVTVKEKTALPFWIWMVIAFAVLLFLRPSISNFIANRKIKL